MKPQSGFTLIEALMAGIISAAIPVLVLATLKMNNSQLQKGVSRIKLTQIYDLVSEEIHRTAYSAALARQAPCEGTFIASHCGVLFSDQAGNFRKGFRVRKPNSSATVGFLEEKTAPAADWKVFLAGPDTVWIGTSLSGFAMKVSGHFNVYNPGGNANYVEGLRFNLRLRMAVGGDAEALSVQTESVLCRNALPWNNI